MGLDKVKFGVVSGVPELKKKQFSKSSGLALDRVYFKIILSYEGNQEFFDYRMGVGHCSLKAPKTYKNFNPISGVVPFYFETQHKHYELLNTVFCKTPQLNDVLNCLFLDVSGVDQDFESWASDYGYDCDSISAKKVYEACIEERKQLKKLFGKDFDEVREEIEKLEL